jgi:hypothetical protein
MFPYCVRRTQIQLNCTAPLYSILMNVALVTTTRYYAPDNNTTSGHIRGGVTMVCAGTHLYTRIVLRYDVELQTMQLCMRHILYVYPLSHTSYTIVDDVFFTLR